MNHSLLTLGELLTMSDEIIKRNAMSILKRLQAKPLQCPPHQVVIDAFEHGGKVHQIKFCLKCRQGQ